LELKTATLPSSQSHQATEGAAWNRRSTAPTLEGHLLAAQGEVIRLGTRAKSRPPATTSRA